MSVHGRVVGRRPVAGCFRTRVVDTRLWLSSRKASRRQWVDAISEYVIPAAVDAKFREVWSCHRAGTHLAAVLVARTALSDVLADAEASRPDFLIESLDTLAP